MKKEKNRFWKIWALPAQIGLVFALALPVSSAPEGDAVRGSVTNLPLPRFVSLKAAEGNVRRGPSLNHRIDWVFRHRDMPLLVTAEFEHWRRVEDAEGQGGWIYYSLLSGARTVSVAVDGTALRVRPDPEAQIVAEAKAGVIGRLGECDPNWCRIAAGSTKGWVVKSALWGVAADELRE
ncbi:SH3 domain-containing protein [Albidovulum sp.]|uniref:SH3 domain-containing protein n=1 Tax=Albidovulum sp. TaxID=1872424 RepID=UPI003D7D9C04